MIMSWVGKACASWWRRARFCICASLRRLMIIMDFRRSLQQRLRLIPIMLRACGTGRYLKMLRARQGLWSMRGLMVRAFQMNNLNV